MKKRILLSPPNMAGTEINYIKEAFETNWIAPVGPHINAFEEEFSSYLKIQDTAMTNSGTAAIHLALQLLNIQEGDIVLCQSFTFVATVNPVLYQKATPVFIDSEEDTWNMSPLALEDALVELKKQNKLPKAIIVVHLYGQSAKMDEIMKLANDYNIPVIEDAAEALGSEYKGRKLGTIGQYGIFSFNGNKIITTSGGGALVSNDSESIKKARYLGSQAKMPKPYYYHKDIGYNYQISNLLAGVGRGQLKVLEKRVLEKQSIYHKYEKHLDNHPDVTLMPEFAETKSNRWLTTLLVEGVEPLSIVKKLEESNIEARLLWKPLHTQPLFKNAPFYKHRLTNDNSVAEMLFNKGLCLPSGTDMSDEEMEYVVKKLIHALG